MSVFGVLWKNGRLDQGAVWVVSGVGPSIGILDGIHISQGEGKGGLGGFLPSVKMAFAMYFKNRNVFECMLCEKLTPFPFGQYIVGIVIKCGFKNLLCSEIKVGIYEKFGKM